MVLASGSEFIDDIKGVPDDILSKNVFRDKVRSVQNGELIIMGIT